MPLVRLIIVLLALMVNAPIRTAFAADSDTDKALEQITKTADRLCTVVQLEGSAQTTKASGAVKAELDGLFKKLADLGISVQASTDASKYQGLLQADLATAIKDRNQCTTHIFDKLVDKLFPDKRSDKTQSIAVALLSEETKPLDGYSFTKTPALSSSLDPGVILPVGGRTRLVFQATDPDAITEIERVELRVSYQGLPAVGTFDYQIDPLKQPGFGAAQPRVFNVKLDNNHGNAIFYTNAANKTLKIKSDNLLEGTDFPLLRLDRQAGLQETLDIVLMAASPGLYQIKFVAHATSQGQEHALTTGSIYVVSK
jgi:hypothetical protein